MPINFRRRVTVLLSMCIAGNLLLNSASLTIAPAAEKADIVPTIGHSSFKHDWSSRKRPMVNAKAFSPNSRFILTGGGDNTIKLWEAQSGRLLRTFEGHREIDEHSREGRGVLAVTFSHDGLIAASGGSDGTVRLWDLANGVLLRTIEARQGPVSAVAFTSDNRGIVSASNTTESEDTREFLKLWDARTGALVHSFGAHPYPVDFIASTQDGFLLSCRKDPEGRDADVVKVWHIATGILTRSLPGSGRVCSTLTLAPDLSGSHRAGMLVGTEAGVTLRIWDYANGRLVHDHRIGHEQLSTVDTTDNGQLLVSTREGLELWHATGPKLTRRSFFNPDAHQQNSDATPLDYVKLSSDGSMLLTPELDLWGVSGRLRTLAGPSTIKSLRFASDNSKLVMAEHDWGVVVWDLASLKTTVPSRLPVRPPAVGAYSQAGVFHVRHFSGGMLAYDAWRDDSDNCCPGQLVDPSTGRYLLPLERDEQIVRIDEASAATFEPGSRSVRIWDMQNRKLLRIETIPLGAGEPVVSAQNKWLAYVYSRMSEDDGSEEHTGSAEIVDLTSGKRRRIRLAQDDRIGGVGFSLDAAQLLTGPSTAGFLFAAFQIWRPSRVMYCLGSMSTPRSCRTARIISGLASRGVLSSSIYAARKLCKYGEVRIRDIGSVISAG
jgi:WD40 repeat protein